MHLKSLTLRGFKSFATATTLRFEPGITCVVGPNGSGKSNVVDALAWVMGEQGAKSLRGGKMEDVVFAGTAGRPPLGRAEVVLTIDNADGALPLDHSEVTLTRTLFRNGSSEYAINGSPCRLLDLQELLSDSGIGREMHVVVGQGQLDTILRATPEDRRGFVEEAAGVLKHRRRKEKALRKLEGTDGNLLRLQDLLGEIRRQLKPLSRQAEVARRAAAVQSDARDARARLLADDITAAREGLAREVADETALRERRARVEAILSAAGREEAELDEVVRTMEPRLTRAQETWYRLSGLRERIGGLGDMAAERMRLSDNEPTETTRGVGSDDLAAQAAQVRDEAQRIGREVDGRREALDEAVGTRQEAEQAAAAADRRVADQARAHADRREGLARLRGAVNTSRTRVKAGEEELSRLEAVRSDAHERMQRASHDFTALETRVAGLSAGEGGLDAEHEGALSALSDVTQRLAKAREEAQLADRERAGLVARMEALQLSLTRRDGAAALLSAADRIPGLRGSVASLLRVRPGYETAVTAALGDAAGGVALDDCASAVGALTHLRERDLGRATVLMAGGPHADPGVHPLPDGATYALDAVEAPADLRPALQRLLGDVVVVADLAAARLLLQDRPEAVAVTKEGDVLGAHVAAGGSAGGPSLFALEVAYDEAREAHEAAVGTSERLRFEVTRWEGECVDAQRRVDVALASLHESDAALAAVVERLGQLGGAARAARAEVER
ncbi:MAG: AAA family ATPase, partial [Nocardioidaceae bacterium]|nr:AAA family ATPase [Nocardioidaceae bacterium]